MNNNDEFESPYPGTAVGKIERYTKRNPLFSQSMSSNAGKGPRGWQRSDDSIKEAVCEALYKSPQVDAREIEVEVNDGVVFLTGSVHDRWMKREAEKCVDRINGIKDVMNKIGFKVL